MFYRHKIRVRENFIGIDCLRENFTGIDCLREKVFFIEKSIIVSFLLEKWGLNT